MNHQEIAIKLAEAIEKYAVSIINNDQCLGHSEEIQDIAEQWKQEAKTDLIILITNILKAVTEKP